MSADLEKKYLLHSREVEGSMDLKGLVNEDDTALIVIGPEGGFSESEVKKAKESGLEIVYLNTPILRTETAGIVASTILLASHFE